MYICITIKNKQYMATITNGTGVKTTSIIETYESNVNLAKSLNVEYLNIETFKMFEHKLQCDINSKLVYYIKHSLITSVVNEINLQDVYEVMHETGAVAIDIHINHNGMTISPKY